MQALLIMNAKNGNVRVIVRLRNRAAENRVASLLERNRAREAFELLKDKAEVRLFLPLGTKLPELPDLTLVEELIAD